MKLFLASMSVQPETVRALIHLTGKPAPDIRLALIPTAADPEVNTWYVEATKRDIEQYNIHVEYVDLKGHNVTSLRDALAPFDVIFVNGGNTFYLLNEVRKSGFDRLLPELLAEGKVYGGSSAGSIIVGPDVSLAGFGPSGDPNDIQLTDLAGLKIVDFAVWPHLNDAERPNVIAGAATVPYPVIAINDKQAVIVDGDRVALIGPGDNLFLNGLNPACSLT